MAEKDISVFRVEELPSNSLKSKENTSGTQQKVAEEKPKNIVKGKVVVKKKSAFTKIKELFFGEDLKTSIENTVTDILVPAAKDAISDSITGTIETLLFGSSGRRLPRRGSSSNEYRPKIDYSSSASSYTNRRVDRRTSSATRSRVKLDDIIFSNREDANNTLDILLEQINKYGKTSVAELYDMVGIVGNYTDNNYGWFELGQATVRRVRDGWAIILPEPEPLD